MNEAFLVCIMCLDLPRFLVVLNTRTLCTRRPTRVPPRGVAWHRENKFGHGVGGRASVADLLHFFDYQRTVRGGLAIFAKIHG